MSKAQEMGMSDEEVANLKEEVAKNGMIGASLGVAQGYIARKEEEANTQAA